MRAVKVYGTREFRGENKIYILDGYFLQHVYKDNKSKEIKK